VATANTGLTSAKGDADNILGSLKNTNGSLHSVCTKTPPGTGC